MGDVVYRDSHKEPPLSLSPVCCMICVLHQQAGFLPEFALPTRAQPAVHIGAVTLADGHCPSITQFAFCVWL